MAEDPEPDDREEIFPRRRRSDLPLLMWLVLGGWVALAAVASALSDMREPSSPDIGAQVVTLMFIGAFLPMLFFDSEGRAYGERGLIAAARQHWSGFVGLAFVAVGIAMLGVNVVMAPNDLASSFWSLYSLYGVVVGAALLGGRRVLGPRLKLIPGAAVALAGALLVFMLANAAFGADLQWARVQFQALSSVSLALVMAAGLGVLAVMDWMIARSERRELENRERSSIYPSDAPTKSR